MSGDDSPSQWALIWMMLRSWFAARWRLVLVVAVALLALLLLAARQSSGSSILAPDSLIVTWEVKPLDLGYTLTFSPSREPAEEVHLPAGVTRYAWPLRIQPGVVTACLERYRAEVSATEQGGCLDVFYSLPKPEPELRLEIRKVPQ